MNTKSLVGIVLGCAILIGGGYIVYTERPVMKLPQPQAEQKTVSQEQQSESAQPSSNQTEKTAVYSLADVSAHAVPENCWSVVSGHVYD